MHDAFITKPTPYYRRPPNFTTPPMPTTDDIAHLQAFLTKWELSGAAERANAQAFLLELCEVLDVPKPDPATPDQAA
ncbi:MAG: hypothetical protein KDC02_03920, partial [Flavobacteriales bacterium]|nr:hypothetical protein [Flavobacteriales bacterium]